MDLSLLNEAQRDAVTCIDHPSLVIAGAGSGKTRVLTYKIAYLLEQGFQPWSILALTFTNKAAREMQERIGTLVDAPLASSLWMGTFHSIFSRILRIESAALGFSPNFTIYDAADSKSLVKSIIRELKLDEKTYKPSTICNRISEAKNGLVFPDRYRMSPDIAERDAKSQISATGEIYMRYMQRCRLSDAMDFDDLLLYTFYLFDKHPDILQKYADRFHFVLVDEYQDTNYAQHRIVWQLTQQRQRVCVVGDDAQSIYSFRGANIDNILKFQQMYEGAKLFKLERNYRSTQNIVNAANSLIYHNRGQIRKEAYSQKSEGNLIRLYNVQSDYEEAVVVSQRIELLHQRDHIPYNDIAILYRTNSQSRSLEDSLRKLGIPYHIYGGLSFYQRKEIKDVIAYLRLTLNPRDEEALRRVINYPTRGIGDTTIQKLMACATVHGVSPWQIIISPDTMQLDVNKGTLTKLTKFAELIMGFHALVDTLNAHELARKVVHEAGVSADINKGHDPEDVSRQENLQELLDGIAAFVEERRESGNSTSLGEYLQEVSLISDLDSDDSMEDGETSDQKVTLMTIHSAKGLEFRVVFVVGLEEELLPNRMAMEEGTRGLEEERRLMYVAMTRAEEQLYLTSARSRFRFGKVEMSNPSRFLREIDSQYITTGSGNGRGTSSSFGSSSSPFSSTSASSRGSSSSLFGSTSASSTGSSSQYPPSVWGKTLRRVSSLPKAAPEPNGNPFMGVPGATPIHASGSPMSDAPGQMSNSSSSSAPSSAAGASPASAASSPQLAAGSIVEHSRFGRGKVISVEGTGLDTKACVDFENVGRKQLLLRFAKIEVVG